MPFVTDLLVQTTPLDPELSTRLVLALLCVVVTSSVAFGVTFGLARRIALLGNSRDPDDQAELDQTRQQPND
jgi:hypothetical protein